VVAGEPMRAALFVAFGVAVAAFVAFYVVNLVTM
jgi:hypothetical protein